MNGFTEHKSDASENRRVVERLLTWGESKAMLPLVGRVARDVIRLRECLAELLPERERLETSRQGLPWPQRARRYQVNEEIASLEKGLLSLDAELEALGVCLLDGDTGLVGFPTLVNNRPAFFSWQPDEEALSWWNFADETVRRPVPEDWTHPQKEPQPRARSKSRK